MAKGETVKDKIHKILAEHPEGLSARGIWQELSKTYACSLSSIASTVCHMARYNAVVKNGTSLCQHCGATSFTYKKGRVNANQPNA